MLSPTQDKSVAFKIFELGLKKYGDIPEYILAYIDYLSHLNGRACVMKQLTKPASLLITVVLFKKKKKMLEKRVNGKGLCFWSAEDNNTRVLFERVLTSGNLSPEKSG